MKKKPAPPPIPFEKIEGSIFLVRGVKVMLDEHLALLYGVTTSALVQGVKRNRERFPEDFMFQLTPEEYAALRSQIVISSGRTGRRYAPFVFTQEGVAMLSSVLRSERAIQANIAIMRTFVKLRELMNSHRELGQKIAALERRYDAQFKVVFNSIRQLIDAKPKDVIEVRSKKRPLGFRRGE
jgi:hypothetical protein